jgi:hypothetical protein
MTIRLPATLADAAEFAERAVGITRTEVAAPAAPRGNRIFVPAPGRGAIRLAVGPGFIPAGTPRKPIPGQTYH